MTAIERDNPSHKGVLPKDYARPGLDKQRLGQLIIRAGDIVACPAGGKEFAHQVINTGNVELRYLAVSTKLSPEIAEYPDSGKLGVLAEFPTGGDGKPQVFRFIGREAHSVNYWEGE